MADEYIDAFQEAYQAVGGLPTLWTEQAREGEARGLPNAVIKDMGSDTKHDKAGPRYDIIKVRFVFYDASSTSAKALRKILTDALGRESIAITGKRPFLFIGPQQSPSNPRRGPKGEFMYMAMVDYTLYSGGV